MNPVWKDLDDLEIIAKSLRNKGNLKESEKIFWWILNQYDKEDSKYFRSISRNLFEIAYIHVVHGQYEEGANFFEKSVDYSKRINDQIGELIGRFWEFFSKFLGKLKTASEVRAFGEQICEKFEALSNQKLSERWTYNIIDHLFQISAEENNKTETKKYFNRYVNNSFYQERKNNEIERIRALSKKGQLAFVNEDLGEAIKYFGKFLNININVNVEKDLSLIKVSDSVHEISREYWYLGRSLEKLGNRKLALEAFDLGLARPYELQNFYYIEKIREELKKIK